MNKIRHVFVALLLFAGMAGCGVGTDLSRSDVEIPDDVGNWLKSELGSAKRKKVWNGDPDRFFREGNARVVGYIAGYDTLMGFSTGIVYVSNELTRQEYPKVIEIAPDGRFEVDIPLLHPSNVSLTINRTWIPVYVEPGHTVAVVVTRDQFPDNRYNRNPVAEYYGASARLNSEIAAYIVDPPAWGEFSEHYQNLSPDEFKALYLGKWDAKKADFAAYAEENALLPETVSIINAGIDATYGEYLFNYVMYRRHSDTASAKEKVPVGYYDFLQRIDMNDPVFLVSRSSGSFLNRFEYAAPFFAVVDKYNSEHKNFYRYLVEDVGIEPDEDDEPFRILMDEFDKMKVSGAKISEIMDFMNTPKNLEISNAFYTKHEKESEAYRVYAMESYNVNRVDRELAQWHDKDSVLVNELGLSPSLLYDITKSRSASVIE